MMKHTTTCLKILLLCLYTLSGRAQSSPGIELRTERQGTQTAFILDFASPFYVGNNVYVLHIGDQSFEQSTQIIEAGKAKMVFQLPDQVFSSLEPGRKIWLSYGRITNIPESQLADLSERMPQYCRILGTFDPTRTDRH
jgi:hypothetical protein